MRNSTSKMTAEVLVVLTMMGSLTQGGLIQMVSGYGRGCDNVAAIFVCTNTDYAFVNWDLRTKSGQNYATSFNNNPEGTLESTSLHNSTIIFNVTYNNRASINTTLTVMNPRNLNGTRITCRGTTLQLILPLKSTRNKLPQQLNISVNESTFNINWNPRGEKLYIQVFSAPNFTINWTTCEASTSFKINSPFNIVISTWTEMNSTSIFTIGLCLFNDVNQNLTEQIYQLTTNGIWTIYQSCNGSVNVPVQAKCAMNGSWLPNSFCTETDITTEDWTTTQDITMASQNQGIEDQHHNTWLNMLIAVIVPTGIVVITISSVIVATLLWFIRNKQKKKLEKNDTVQRELVDMTYQQLMNNHHSDHAQRRFNIVERNHDQSEYSTLHYNGASDCSSDHYDKIQTNRKSESQKVKYLDVYNSCNTDYMESNVIHIKVDYSDVRPIPHPEDKTLNLDSLLIQLRPISEHFKLFGSVAGISPVSLNKIVDSSAIPFDGLVEVCDAWLDKCRKENTPPTWSAVAEILSLIGQDKLSHDITQVYTTGKLPIEVDMKSVISVSIPREAGQPSPFLPPPVPPHLEDINRKSNYDPLNSVSVMHEKIDYKTPPIMEDSRASTPVVETEDELPPPVPPYNPKIESSWSSNLKNNNEPTAVEMSSSDGLIEPPLLKDFQPLPQLPPKLQSLPRKPRAKIKESTSTEVMRTPPPLSPRPTMRY